MFVDEFNKFNLMTGIIAFDSDFLGYAVKSSSFKDNPNLSLYKIVDCGC